MNYHLPPTILSLLTRGAEGVCGFSWTTAFTPPIPPCQGGTEFGHLEDHHA